MKLFDPCKQVSPLRESPVATETLQELLIEIDKWSTRGEHAL
jgi:hypothetical protein